MARTGKQFLYEARKIAALSKYKWWEWFQSRAPGWWSCKSAGTPDCVWHTEFDIPRFVPWSPVCIGHLIQTHRQLSKHNIRHLMVLSKHPEPTVLSYSLALSQSKRCTWHVCVQYEACRQDCCIVQRRLKHLVFMKSPMGEMSCTLISVATRAWLLSSRAASTCTLHTTCSSSKAWYTLLWVTITPDASCCCMPSN